MDWPGCLSLDLPHRAICAALVLAHLLVLVHFVSVECLPCADASSGGSGTVGLWWDALHHDLPLRARF